MSAWHGNATTARPRRKLKLHPRSQRNWPWLVGVLVVALLMSALVSTFLFWLAGADAAEGFASLFKGAFGSWRAVMGTLVKATPLIFTGLAAAVAFRARIWNIGAEGQLFAGAMAAYQASILGDGLPRIALLSLIILAGCVGGAAYGALAAIFKIRFRVDEIISTVMLNYIILFVLSYLLLEGPWGEPGSVYQQTPKIGDLARLPRLLDRSRLHLGFPLALLAAVGLHILFKRMTLGLEIRAFGANPTAALFKGIKPDRMVLIVFLISGAVAGLAGVSETFGIHHRLRPDISIGFGYTGIIVAMLGGLRPLGVVGAAIFFGGLVNASVKMQIATGVPSALVYAIQATILLFVLAGLACSRYRLSWAEADE